MREGRKLRRPLLPLLELGAPRLRPRFGGLAARLESGPKFRDLGANYWRRSVASVCLDRQKFKVGAGATLAGVSLKTVAAEYGTEREGHYPDT
jgi:hypothetical protein